jgi:hypothetical protein
LNHAVETIGDDFGIVSGTDYVSVRSNQPDAAVTERWPNVGIEQPFEPSEEIGRSGVSLGEKCK